jgi:hypothetical protein
MVLKRDRISRDVFTVKEKNVFFVTLLLVCFICSIALAGQWKTYTTANSSLSNNWVTFVAIDSAGNKWLGTNGGGVSKLSANGTFTTYTHANSGLPGDDICAIAIDAFDNKWISAQADLAQNQPGGISRLAADGVTWTTYAPIDGAPNNLAFAIAIDGQGNKWFGTYGSGVAKLSANGTTWKTYSTSNSGLVNNTVVSVAVDAQGTKWFGTSDGVSTLKDTTWTTYKGFDVLYWVNSFAFDKSGNTWLGSSGGVMKFDGTNWTTYRTTTSGLVSNSVNSVAIDGQNRKWFGTANWISRLSSNDSTWTTLVPDSLAANTGHNVYSIAVDGQGNKWFGTVVGLAEYIDTAAVAPGTMVSGYVLDSTPCPGGNCGNLQGALIKFRQSGLSTTTDKNGWFSLAEPEGLADTLLVTKSRYVPYKTGIPANANIFLNIKLLFDHDSFPPIPLDSVPNSVCATVVKATNLSLVGNKYTFSLYCPNKPTNFYCSQQGLTYFYNFSWTVFPKLPPGNPAFQSGTGSLLKIGWECIDTILAGYSMGLTYTDTASLCTGGCKGSLWSCGSDNRTLPFTNSGGPNGPVFVYNKSANHADTMWLTIMTPPPASVVSGANLKRWTGVPSISKLKNAALVYDVRGRRIMGRTYSGVAIVNGRKILIMR